MREEVRRLVVQRLIDDTELYPAMVPGGIYDRKLARGGTQGATPAVWAIDPGDPARIARLRPAIAVFGPNEVDAPDGPVQTEDLQLKNGFLRVFIYAPRTSQGKDSLDEIDARVRSRLQGWQTQLSHGFPMTVVALDGIESTDSDEFDDAIVTYRRYVAEYLRPAF